MLELMLSPDDGERLVLRLEHSLVSLSKWESIHEKPFFKDEQKTPEEDLDYIRAMCLDKEFDVTFLKKVLTQEDIRKVNEYINGKHTATWFNEANLDKKKAPSNETITSELIYYWMIAFNIPSDYQYWNLSRLLTLIQICGIKQSPPKKMDRISQHEMMRQLNAQRKAQMNTSG